MYIDFNELCDKYGTPIGVVHIGAHLCEERPLYSNRGIDKIIWVEANPDLFSIIEKTGGGNEMFIQSLISDIDDHDYDFHITNNGQSSSILDLEKHKQYHPDVFVVSDIRIKSSRMDSIISKHRIKTEDYDFLNLDIQGAELLALHGFGDKLSMFKYIYLEVNTAHLYKDCALLDEIDLYLSGFGFNRMETHMTDWEWGDAFYVRSSVL